MADTPIFPAWSGTFQGKNLTGKFNPAFAYSPNTSIYQPTTYTTSANNFATPTVPTPSTTPGMTAEPGVSEVYRQLAALEPLIDVYAQKQAERDFAFTQRNLQATYPYLSQAAAEATARNLGASIRFYKEKQQSAANVQDIMASIQGQRSSAADAEYRRALGTAAQQEAATNFARRYAGQTFSTA